MAVGWAGLVHLRGSFAIDQSLRTIAVVFLTFKAGSKQDGE
jgi:hypothetical protein